MEEATARPSAASRAATDTPVAASEPRTSEDAAASSAPGDDFRLAAPPAPDGVRKGSNEWTSSRSRGTPPPIPRRGSRSEEHAPGGTGGGELPPRPRTPAQVLASRAQVGKAASPRGSAVETMWSGEAESDARSKGAEPENASTVAKEEESFSGGGSTATRAEGVERGGGRGGGAETEAEMEEGGRTSIQLGATLSEADVAREEEERESMVHDEYQRDERVDTSTVDEESMYNDDDCDDEEEDGGGEEYERASAGTSDEYVNVHDDEEDEQQRQHGADDSLTPENTPPPSPVRPVQPPPPLASDWIKYVAESGHEYYFNARTQVTQWTRPSAMLSPTSTSAAIDDEPENQTQVEATLHLPQPSMSEPVHVQIAGVYPPTVVVPSECPPVAPYSENLFVAVTKNDETAQLQSILQFDVEVNAVNPSGLTPLHVAVQHGNARGAAMLLDYGAFVDGPVSDGGIFATARLIETPLVMACRTNHASLVRLLVRYGASIYTRDVDGNTVLHIAIRCWSDEVLGCLLEMDSMSAIINQRNADDETPLHLAARHGNANAVRGLLASGASTDVEDAQGRTPLVVSIMENRVDCAQLLQGFNHDEGHAGYAAEAPVTVDDGLLIFDAIVKTSGENADESSTTRGSDELNGLRVYLAQLLQHTMTDAVLVSAIYQYMDTAQRDISTLKTRCEDARQREEALLSQIDSLTSNESSASIDLAKEREESDRLRLQLESKDIEMGSMASAYESLASRATMLESIARTSQDKLRRERAEHTRQEEYWSQTIDTSLRENAVLLDFIHSLQPGWKHDVSISNADQVAGYKVEDQSADRGIYQETFDPQVSYDAYGNALTSDSYLAGESYGFGFQDDPSQNRSNPNQQYAQANVPAAKPPRDEPERPISPARVDAVWSRFFENMSQAADGGGLPPGDHNSTLSPRHGPAAVSMLPPASAVFDSIRKDNKDRLQQLLLSGISPNIRDLGERGTPLHLASELGDLDAVMLLCEFGADVEIRDENGNTPLLVACSQGHFECTKFLLQSAANQRAYNLGRDTALHLAAWDGSFECVDILLEYGVDVLARNSLGLTALANLKTRSPMRHRFEDLAKDHPMAKTIAILEEAQHAEMTSEEAESPPATAGKAPAIAPAFKSSKTDTQATASPSASSISWGRWFLGSVFGAAKPPAPAEPEEASDEEETKSDFEEAQSSPSKLRAALSDYEDLRPPPEIEAELRRTSLGSTLDAVPPPPLEVLEALERRTLGKALSPSSSTTRFASPAATSSKKTLQTTPTSVRSRYVDTFNSP